MYTEVMTPERETSVVESVKTGDSQRIYVVCSYITIQTSSRV